MMQLNSFQRSCFFPPGQTTPSIFYPLCAGVLVVLVTFGLFPLKEFTVSLSLSVIFLYIILSINVYPVLISGWASNRKYALLGALRSVAQTVSYEVRLALILIFYLVLSSTLNLMFLAHINIFWYKVLIFLPMAGI